MTSSSSSSSYSSTTNLSAEIIKNTFHGSRPVYDNHELYKSSLEIGFHLVCPVRRYGRKTPEEMLELVDFYESSLGQVVYSSRGVHIHRTTPIEHIKSVFRIDPVPVRGYDKVRGIVLLSVLLLYQILVYYNYINKNSNPRRMIKYMIGL